MQSEIKTDIINKRFKEETKRKTCIMGHRQVVRHWILIPAFPRFESLCPSQLNAGPIEKGFSVIFILMIFSHSQVVRQRILIPPSRWFESSWLNHKPNAGRITPSLSSRGLFYVHQHHIYIRWAEVVDVLQVKSYNSYAT